MQSSQVEISIIEINPNRLRDYSSVPLPDFAVSALLKNGINYESREPTNIRADEHNLQQPQNVKSGCKLKQHFHNIVTNIDKDGARIFAGGDQSSKRDV